MFDDSDLPKWFCDQNLLCEIEPLFPFGEKVADRPDEGAFVGGNHSRNDPLTPALSLIFLRVCCNATPRNMRKKMGERGQHADVQFSCVPSGVS